MFHKVKLCEQSIIVCYAQTPRYLLLRSLCRFFVAFRASFLLVTGSSSSVLRFVGVITHHVLSGIFYFSILHGVLLAVVVVVSEFLICSRHQRWRSLCYSWLRGLGSSAIKVATVEILKCFTFMIISSFFQSFVLTLINYRFSWNLMIQESYKTIFLMWLKGKFNLLLINLILNYVYQILN